ncbi:hypothetical protein CapIbe_014117 [Capra ibex]
MKKCIGFGESETLGPTDHHRGNYQGTAYVNVTCPASKFQMKFCKILQGFKICNQFLLLYPERWCGVVVIL